jgi:hypothetical protein
MNGSSGIFLVVPGWWLSSGPVFPVDEPVYVLENRLIKMSLVRPGRNRRYAAVSEPGLQLRHNVKLASPVTRCGEPHRHH